MQNKTAKKLFLSIRYYRQYFRMKFLYEIICSNTGVSNQENKIRYVGNFIAISYVSIIDREI